MINIVANFIREWLKDIVVLFVIISLVELIIPKGNMKKYVDFIIGIIIVFTVISPFTKLINFDINLDEKIETFSNDITMKEDVVSTQNEQIEEIFKTNLSSEIKKIVKENSYYKVKDIYISTKPDDQNLLLIEYINIILDTDKQSKDSEIKIEKINLGNESIPVSSSANDFEELKNLIIDYLQIDEERLIISVKKGEERYGRNN
ncbi:stage III sporulation protein AF [Paratissierella segnis]|uniref:stage III sporulation protein AF n=1 Tax=Paratissierella segnis TaxID=2763679 RepID=UPI0021E373F1|nr:stage III sporulation protein AF [Paratissierella segnis]